MKRILSYYLLLTLSVSLYAQQKDSLKSFNRSLTSIDTLNLLFGKTDSLAAEAGKKLNTFETKEQKIQQEVEQISKNAEPLVF